MRQKLGIVLTPYGQIPGAPPWEVGYLYGGDGTYLCPEDEMHNTRGEMGLYPDTQLGGVLGRGIPTDDELASRYGYVPLINGDVLFKQGIQPGTWIPPNGWNPAGGYGPQFQPASTQSLNGFDGLDDGTTDSSGISPTVVVSDSQSGQFLPFHASTRKKIDWLLVLTTASTAGVLISTVFSIVLQLRRIKKG